MLARQWQLGEFEGEDAGSPICSVLNSREYKILNVLFNGLEGNSISYDDNMPLETLIEKTKLEISTKVKKENESDNMPISSIYVSTPQLDLQMRVKMGLHFQHEMYRILQDMGIQSDKINDIKQYFVSHNQNEEFRLSFDDLNEKQQESEIDSTTNYLSAIQGRVIDIYKIYHEPQALTILRDKSKAKFVDDSSLADRIADGLAVAFTNLKHWWDGNVTSSSEEDEEPFFETPVIESGTNNNSNDNDNHEYYTTSNAWDPRHLEYSFKVQLVPRLDNNNNNNNDTKLLLDASEYKEDLLDWYSFTLEEEFSAQQPISESKKVTLTPTQLKFTGMPEKRWWNFEDSYVDFGSLEPKKNNIASILLMEFALVHSSDWYVIPYQMRLGTLSKIDSLEIIDSFGDQTIIEPAGFTAREKKMLENNKSWYSWNMFSLSKKYKDQDPNNTNISGNIPYFFLPPTTDHNLSGPALEEIKFLRDEIANLTWGIEKAYRSLYGEPISGYETQVPRNNNNNEQSRNNNNEDISNNLGSNKPVKYTLMTTVPPNWIPFIPVHTTNFLSNPVTNLPSQLHIELQRGSIINPKTKEPQRPNSRLLNEVPPPYYIDESEIPRSGIIISEKCRRIMWHNGKIFLWIGRKKSVGTGEGSSALKFDSIPLDKKM